MLTFVSLNGFGAGPCESMMPQIIADVIFLHDRGKYQTLYFTIYFGSLAVRARTLFEHDTLLTSDRLVPL